MFLARSRRLVFAAFVAGALFAAPASAQTIVDARRIEFTPSADHNIVDAAGVPAVQRYTVDVFVAGGIVPVTSADLGKPVPASDGMIRLDFVALLSSPLATGITYEAAVQAVGPGGTSAAVRSNPFSFSAPCAYSATPASASFTAAGGSGSTAVTAGSGCAWTAVSNTAWITVTSGASGTGSGSAGFSVAANTATASRSGTLTIAGTTVTVTQAAASCTFSATPASASFAAAGGTGSTAVTAGSGCAWTAVSNTGWITVTSGASGSGNGGVSFSVAANTATASRSGTLTIAGTTVTVTQAAASCAFSATPASASFAAAGGSGSTTVTAGSGCAWMAVSNTGWITVTSGASGSGNGGVSFSVAANTATASRSGTLMIAGTTVTVTQAAATTAGCASSITPTTRSFTADGGTGSSTVAAPSTCAWDAVSNVAWIAVLMGAPGTGNGTVSFVVALNGTGASRTGTLTIAGRTFTVTQAGPCSYTVSPTTLNVSAGAVTGAITVSTQSGCAWAPSAPPSWITLSGPATGSGALTYTVAQNLSKTARTGSFTIAGKTVTLTQAGRLGPPSNVRVLR